MATRLTPEELKQISTFRKRTVFFCFVTPILFCSWPADSFICRLLSTTISSSKQKPIENRDSSSSAPRYYLWIRTGELLAANEPIYTLEITPESGGLAKTIESLEKIIPITKYDKKRFYRLKDELPSFESCAFKE